MYSISVWAMPISASRYIYTITGTGSTTSAYVLYIVIYLFSPFQNIIRVEKNCTVI